MKTIFRNSIFSILAILLFSIASCNQNNLNNSNLSIENIAGNWVEVEDTDEIHFSGSSHKFLLEEEGTFQLEEDYWTDALDPDDPCTINRIDYVEGTFSLTSDRIHFEGSFTNSDYTALTPNCEGKSKYHLQATISMEDNVLILQEANGESIHLVRQEE